MKMKRKLLLGLSLLLVSFGYSQFTPIPDSDFEDALIAKGIDTNPVRDGQVLTSAIENLRFLNLTSQDVLNFTKGAVGLGIKDVTGIKDFVSLDSLWVQDNDLTNLDLEGMTSLKLVRAFYNNLANINIDGLANLETIGLVNNQLHTVNLATNTKLKKFDITQNSLTFLDVRGISTLERITAEQNPNLTCILVENVTTAALYNSNANFLLDGNTIFDENCVNPYTQIPDRNFEQSLIDQGYDSEGGVPNGLVLTQDLEAITSLDLSGTNFSGQNIVSLEGLDAFTGLTDLNISYNPLSLPNNDLVLTNSELKTIIARNCNLDGASFPTILNEVVTLDLSNEDPRDTTIPSVNSFSSINGLGGVPNVTTFRIEWNNLTLLEVAGAPKIEKLFLGKNFDLAEIRSLNTLVNLNQMEADDNSLGLGAPIGTIDVSGNANLEILNLDRSKITDIDLSNNTKLRLLSISDVNLSPTIDLSANTSLTFLDLERSQLTSLSLGANILLDRIELDGNNLTDLNLSQNINLFSIKLANNKLTALDISNLTALTNVDVSDNQNLNCVLVANTATATSYNNNSNFIKNGTTSFSANCNTPEPFTASVTITNAGTTPNYEIEEGKSFELNFDTGSTGTDGTIYKPNIFITKGGVATSEDFAIDDLDRSFTISAANPDGSIIFTANDDGVPEGDEVYTITVSSSNTTQYTITQPTTFTIIVKDKNENNGLFDVNVSLGGDVVNLGNQENPNYQINEGGVLLINIETSNGPDYGTQYSFFYSDNQTQLPNDFIRNFEYNEENQFLGFVASETENPDSSYGIQVTKDNTIDNVGEQIELSFSPDQNFNLNNLGNNKELNFIISIIDIDNTSSDSIFADFDNTGGTEGGNDTFAIKLTEGGNPWVNNTNQDIVFPVIFTNEKLDGTQIDLAENGDYSPSAGNIVIPPNQSTGSLQINLIEDTDQDHEFYLATLQDHVSQVSITKSNRAIEAKIIDKNGVFKINATIVGTTTYYPAACCPEYSIEEGQLLQIQLEAEKGVEDELPFNLQISYAGSAEENSDFRNRDTRAPTTPDNIFGYSVKTNKDPDNIIEILMLLDTDSNENDDFSFSIVSTEMNKYVVGGETGRQMLLLDVIPASIKPKVTMAYENPLVNGEFTISLDTDSPTVLPTRIYYEFDEESSATQADFQPLTGYVDIPEGMYNIDFSIEPVDDSIYEELETVRIRLIDSVGYSIKQSASIASITINSEDMATYIAEISRGEDFKSRESDTNDFAEILIELDQLPTTDVEVIIKISQTTKTDDVIEGQDYNIYQDDKSTLISSENRTVLFKAGEPKTKSIFIKALPDDVLENNESLWLALDSGVNYSISAQNDAEIELISSESDTSSFNPSDIKLVAKSPRCPGNDQLGDISLENDSPFLFDVTVVGLDGIDYDSTQTLDKNNSADNTQPFDNLVIGSYLVSMKFKPANNADYPDVILPNYVVQIVPFVGMSAEEDGIVDKVISLTVAGSTSYAVTTNGKNYQFEFSDITENTIKIPLENGVNDLKIKGDSECKGILNKSILLNVVNVYPNPGKEIVFVNSASLPGKVDIQLFDITGQLVYHKSTDQNMNSMTINVSALENGMYLGVMKPENQEGIEFKLIKN